MPREWANEQCGVFDWPFCSLYACFTSVAALSKDALQSSSSSLSTCREYTCVYSLGSPSSCPNDGCNYVVVRHPHTIFMHKQHACRRESNHTIRWHIDRGTETGTLRSSWWRRRCNAVCLSVCLHEGQQPTSFCRATLYKRGTWTAMLSVYLSSAMKCTKPGEQVARTDLEFRCVVFTNYTDAEKIKHKRSNRSSQQWVKSTNYGASYRYCKGVKEEDIKHALARFYDIQSGKLPDNWI